MHYLRVIQVSALFLKCNGGAVMTDVDIVIIGGGASGLTAALYAAKNIVKNGSGKKASIYVIEHKDTVGKKLLATGNGRCNFTNDIIDNESFRGKSADFAYSVIEKYDQKILLKELEKIGVLHTCINGYYYPRSLQASQVLNSICSSLDKYGVKIICNTNVTDIRTNKNKYLISTDKENYAANYIVLSTGGKAYKSLGSDGSGYSLVTKLGHTVSKLVPSLIGLKAKGLEFKLCHGVRVKGMVTIYADDRKLSSSYGEIQFAEYGISGIPVFQISRYASMAMQDRHKVIASIDLLNDYSYEDALVELNQIIHNNKGKNILDAVNAFVPYKLGLAILKKLGIDPKTSVIKDNNITKRICSYMKNMQLTIIDDCGFEKAQVTAGGVLTSEIDNKTMESKKNPNVYITGELLDIDGNCGGYNLHFAFATGALAGISIGKKVNK